MTETSASYDLRDARCRPLQRAAFIWLIFGVLALLPNAALADSPAPVILEENTNFINLAEQLGYYEDATSSLAAADLTREEGLGRFEPDGRAAINRGLNSNALWATAELVNRGQLDTWYLVVSYPPLDEVELVIQRGNGQLETFRPTGDRFPFSQRIIQVPGFVFPISIAMGEKIRVFLRIRTAGARFSPVSLHSPQHLMGSLATQQTVRAIYFGGLIMLMLYTLLLFFYFRRPQYLIFAGLNLGLLLWFMGEAGLIHQYFFPDNPWLSSQLMVVSQMSIAALGLLLNLIFLRRAATKKQVATLKLLIGISTGFLAVSLFLPYGLGVRIGLLLVALYVCSTTYLSLMCWKNGYRPAGLFLAGGLALICSCIVVMVRDLGLVSINSYTMDGPLLGVAIFLGLIAIALTDKISHVQRTKENLSESFAKFVPKKLVNEVLESGEVPRLGGEVRDVTVLFSDIKGYSTIIEHLSPTRVVELLTEYFEEMQCIVEAHNGAIIEYVGDGILAIFGAPLELEGHPSHATRCALAMQEQITELNNRWHERGITHLWRSHGIEKFHIRIGVHSGRVVAGNMGSRNTMKYSVVGDPVNVAARLEHLNVKLGTGILVSKQVYDRLEPELKSKAKDEGPQVLKGRTQAEQVYSFGGPTGDVVA